MINTYVFDILLDSHTIYTLTIIIHCLEPFTVIQIYYVSLLRMQEKDNKPHLSQTVLSFIQFLYTYLSYKIYTSVKKNYIYLNKDYLDLLVSIAAK